jgi:methylthioribulose-1-phosphate dehydratase
MKSTFPLDHLCDGRTGTDPAEHLADAMRAIQEVGGLFYARGWSLATSSNFSCLLQRRPFRLLITASGCDKGRLEDKDFVIVDDAGQALEPGPRPSAETQLHVALAEQPGVGAVLHTHSIWGTILSERSYQKGELTIKGYEMLKGLAGVNTHEHQERLAIFPNTQDIPELAARFRAALADTGPPRPHAFLIRRHGLYTWGQDLDEARRHVEVLEFLFEVLGRSH